MQAIQIGKLKSEFSSVLHKIEQNGESFVVEYGKKHKKIAMIIPYDEAYENKQTRQFGLMESKGSYHINDDFEISDDELIGL